MRSLRPRAMLRRMIATASVSLAVALSAPVLAGAAEAARTVTAAQLPAEVTTFRQAMTTQLDAYLNTYGDRLNTTERQQMNALRDEVDRELLTLRTATQRTARLAKAHAPAANQRSAARAAARAFDAAYAKAIRVLEQVEPILRPKLSLFEALGAKSDLDAQLERFDELGRHIHGLAGR